MRSGLFFKQVYPERGQVDPILPSHLWNSLAEIQLLKETPRHQADRLPNPANHSAVWNDRGLSLAQERADRAFSFPVLQVLIITAIEPIRDRRNEASWWSPQWSRLLIGAIGPLHDRRNRATLLLQGGGMRVERDLGPRHPRCYTPGQCRKPGGAWTWATGGSRCTSTHCCPK